MGTIQRLPQVHLDPTIRALSDAARAVRYLNDAGPYGPAASYAARRELLEAALGAALALQVDVQDALRDVGARISVAELTEAQAADLVDAGLGRPRVDADLDPTLQRAQDGDR